MHALALVIGDVETVMAPYDENLDLPHFWQSCDTDWLITRWPECRTGPTPQLLLERLRAEWPADAELYRLAEDGTSIEYWSDCNPQGRWDYWSIGGRFSDHLILKPDHLGIHGERSNESHPQLPGRCDGGLLGAIDLGRMRDRAVIDAAARWDRWHAGPDIEDPMSVEEFPEWILGYSRGQFIERARLAAVPGHALVTSDRWITQPIGWCGPQDAAERAAELEYLTIVNELLDGADESTSITCADYHR